MKHQPSNQAVVVPGLKAALYLPCNLPSACAAPHPIAQFLAPFISQRPYQPPSHINTLNNTATCSPLSEFTGFVFRPAVWNKITGMGPGTALLVPGQYQYIWRYIFYRILIILVLKSTCWMLMHIPWKKDVHNYSVQHILFLCCNNNEVSQLCNSC